MSKHLEINRLEDLIALPSDSESHISPFNFIKKSHSVLAWNGLVETYPTVLLLFRQISLKVDLLHYSFRYTGASMRLALLLLLFGNAQTSAHSSDELNTMRTFGTGKSEFLITPEETVLFNYNVSAPESYGVFTHFWITGSPAGGGGSDNATVRYYIDGEETASIEFKPPLATGVGFDDLAVWGTEKAGKW